jgi:hypothetical protein
VNLKITFGGKEDYFIRRKNLTPDLVRYPSEYRLAGLFGQKGFPDNVRHHSKSTGDQPHRPDIPECIHQSGPECEPDDSHEFAPKQNHMTINDSDIPLAAGYKSHHLTTGDPVWAAF